MVRGGGGTLDQVAVGAGEGPGQEDGAGNAKFHVRGSDLEPDGLSRDTAKGTGDPDADGVIAHLENTVGEGDGCRGGAGDGEGGQEGGWFHGGFEPSRFTPPRTQGRLESYPGWNELCGTGGCSGCFVRKPRLAMGLAARWTGGLDSSPTNNLQLRSPWARRATSEAMASPTRCFARYT